MVYNAGRADVIVGPFGIILPNAMNGEITPLMAQAVAGAKARKVLIPFSQCAVAVAGLGSASLESYIRQAVELVLHPQADNE